VRHGFIPAKRAGNPRHCHVLPRLEHAPTGPRIPPAIVGHCGGGWNPQVGHCGPRESWQSCSHSREPQRDLDWVSHKACFLIGAIGFQIPKSTGIKPPTPRASFMNLKRKACLLQVNMKRRLGLHAFWWRSITLAQPDEKGDFYTVHERLNVE